MRKNIESKLLGRLAKSGGELYRVIAVYLPDHTTSIRVLLERCDSFGRSQGGKPVQSFAEDIELQ